MAERLDFTGLGLAATSVTGAGFLTLFIAGRCFGFLPLAPVVAQSGNLTGLSLAAAILTGAGFLTLVIAGRCFGFLPLAPIVIARTGDGLSVGMTTVGTLVGDDGGIIILDGHIVVRATVENDVLSAIVQLVVELGKFHSYRCINTGLLFVENRDGNAKQTGVRRKRFPCCKGENGNTIFLVNALGIGQVFVDKHEILAKSKFGGIPGEDKLAVGHSLLQLYGVKQGTRQCVGCKFVALAIGQLRDSGIGAANNLDGPGFNQLADIGGNGDLAGLGGSSTGNKNLFLIFGHIYHYSLRRPIIHFIIDDFFHNFGVNVFVLRSNVVCRHKEHALDHIIQQGRYTCTGLTLGVVVIHGADCTGLGVHGIEDGIETLRSAPGRAAEQIQRICVVIPDHLHGLDHGRNTNGSARFIVDGGKIFHCPAGAAIFAGTLLHLAQAPFIDMLTGLRSCA